VLCEKPMTLDPAEACELVDLARRRGTHLLIANSYHYAPRLAEVRDLLQGGIVGRIEHVMVSFISATRPVFEGAVGFRRWQTTFFRPDRATWQSPAQGGGFAHGQMSHAVPLMLWLTGLEAMEVSARTLDKDGIDICDAATVLCDGGAVVSLSGAPAMPEGRRALMRLFIAGSAGLAIVELDRDRCEIQRDDGREIVIEPGAGAWAPAAAGPPDALVDLALGRGTNHAPGEIGAASVAIIDACLRSARSGVPQAVWKPGGRA
jgi:predicted dehydrogenase